MKLLFCPQCGDIFNLRLEITKSCSCGFVKGRYVNFQDAEVNGQGYSIAIGNGSILSACAHVERNKNQKDWRVEASKDNFHKEPFAILCWARSHTGESNPHTKINPNLE